MHAARRKRNRPLGTRWLLRVSSNGRRAVVPPAKWLSTDPGMTGVLHSAQVPATPAAANLIWNDPVKSARW